MTVAPDCSSQPRNVLVVVADEVNGKDLCQRLTATRGLRCCGIATSLGDGIEMLRPGAVHAVIVGEGLPDGGVWSSVRAFRDLDAGAAVVVLATEPKSDSLREARLAGAAGFVGGDFSLDDLPAVVWLGSRGRMYVDADLALGMTGAMPDPLPNPAPIPEATMLTPREMEVLQLLGRGMDPTSIAGELDLSIHTARGHVKRILGKLGAHSQLEAVIIAVQLGVLPQLGRN
jgi:DNA-binding NarL/FixJ family response regulator